MHNIPGFNSRFSSVAAAIVTRAANKKASLEKVAQVVLPPGFNWVGLYNKLSPELKQFGHTLTDPQQSLLKKFFGLDPAIPRGLTNSSPVNMKGYADNFLDDLSGKIQTGFQPNYNHSDFLIRPAIPVPPPPPSVFSRAMSHAGAGALAATGTGVAAFGTQKAYQGLSNRYGQQAASRLY